MELVIGRIGKPHGVRGEVNVGLRTDAPEERFEVGTTIRTDPVERGPLVVQSARSASGRFVLGFEGVADRTAAEALQGIMLVIDTDELPALDDEDDFYDHELVGMRADLLDGTSLGTVTDVIHGLAGDTLAVKPKGAKEILIPFAKAIVPAIDRVNRTLTVDPPEGLLEL